MHNFISFLATSLPCIFCSLARACTACRHNVRKLRKVQTKTEGEHSGSVLDSRPRDHRFKPHRRHCVVSLSKNINPSLVLVQPRKTCPFITERLLMERKDKSNKKQKSMTLSQQAPLGSCFCMFNPFLSNGFYQTC